MALTADEFVALETTGLVKFFGLHRESYLRLARRAYSYARSYLDEAGIEVRVNDVAVALEPALHVRAELREFLAGQVAHWQLPERWAFIDEVPKTSVGKFDKKVLRQRFAEGALEVRRL